METDPPKLGVLQTLFKMPALQVVVVEGIPFSIAEHPVRNFARGFARSDADEHEERLSEILGCKCVL